MEAEKQASDLRYPSLTHYDPLTCLQLIRSDNVGPVTFFQLLSQYGNAEAALAALPRFYASKKSKKALKACTKEQATKELEAIHKYGAQLLCYGSDAYPDRLKHIYDPPPMLTAWGNTTLYERPTIAIVGARNASSHAKSFAGTLAKELGKQSITIISGLARGIDTSAHLTSLETGTIAVTACGIDQIYPSENQKLYHEIVEQGLILTEQPFGTSPTAQNFPRRNRIISGISEGVAVIEASLKSGSLITARFAAEQGREVYAVPGFPLDPRSKGTNNLLKNGATLLESSADIIDIIQHPQRILHEPPAALLIPFTTSSSEEVEIDTNSEETVLSSLHFTPTDIDTLLHDTGLTAARLQTILLELELTGRIERHAGGCIALTPDAIS